MYLLLVGLAALYGASNVAHNTVDQLIAKPLVVLQEMQRIQEQFSDSMKSLEPNVILGQEFASHYARKAQEFEASCPLFSLHECSTFSCRLSRCYQPAFREAYAKKVTEMFDVALQNKPDQPISFVSFGCGGCFQDAHILVSILQRNPTMRMQIHLIDDIFFPFHNACLSDPIAHMPTVRMLLEPANGVAHNCGVLLTQLRFGSIINQLSRFLRSSFPQADLSFQVYPSARAYLHFMARNQLASPDIVVAADIDDFLSQQNHAVEQFTELCVAAQRLNSAAQNIYLTRTGLLSAALVCIVPQQDTAAVLLESETINQGRFGAIGCLLKSLRSAFSGQ